MGVSGGVKLGWRDVNTPAVFFASQEHRLIRHFLETAMKMIDVH